MMLLFSNMLLHMLWRNYQMILLLLMGIIFSHRVYAVHGILVAFVLGGISAYGRRTKKVFIIFISIFVSLLVLSKMLGRTNFFPLYIPSDNCTNHPNPLSIIEHMSWMYLTSSNFYLTDLTGYFVILWLGTIFRHVEVYKLSNFNEASDNTVRRDFDDNIVGAVKFTFRYGFFKFGVEICKITMAALIITHNDVFGVVYGMMLLLTLYLSRLSLSRIWWFLRVISVYCIIHQYAMAIGATSGFCHHYFGSIDGRLRKWLFLPHKENIELSLIGDFILLVLLSEQGKVFYIENKGDHPAGSNQEIFQIFSNQYVNPVPDHLNLSRPGIDHLKSMMFFAINWGSLIIYCTIGGTRSDLLSLAYLIMGFIMILQDADFALRKVNRLRKWWNTFMLCSVLSMILKSALTELICFVDESSYFHWFWRFTSGSVCGGGNSLGFDLLAFSFLVFQRRFIESHYFLHYVNDLKATIALHTCIAQLIAKLKRENVRKAEQERDKTVNKIKTNMEIIKEYNKRTNVVEPSSHDEAILAGDYFMFEDVGRPELSESQDQQHFLDGLKFHKPNLRVKERQQKPSQSSRMYQILKTLKRVLIQSLEMVINCLNYYSREFRFIAWAMKTEKMKLKSSGVGRDCNGYSVDSLTFPDIGSWQDEKTWNVLIELITAIWFTFLNYSETICFIAILFLQGLAPTLVSLPMPLMLFLWGSLTLRHPSSTFWTTLIAYTEVVMVLKALFNNDIFNWKENRSVSGRSQYAPYIVGITHVSSADVFLLVILFFNRKKLETFGLWQGKAFDDSLITPSFMGNRIPNSMASLKEYFRPAINFLKNLQHPLPLSPVDCYTWSFICEFLTLIIIFVGFSSFVPQDSFEGQVFYLAENDIPSSYLIALILQFAYMIIDRVLYLRRNVSGKLFLYVLSVLVYHIWLFLLMPIVTLRLYSDLVWPKLWYTVQCVSFLLSAYQLRNGYPTRVNSFFLANTYTYLSLYAIRVLKFAPFFLPLRHMIGWVSTKTSLTLYEWYLMESMYTVIYEVKCYQEIARNDPSPRGKPYPTNMKWVNGSLVLFGFFLLIWAPLILFAFFNTVAVPDPPTEAAVSFRVNDYQTLYSTALTEDQILPLKQNDFLRILSAIERIDKRMSAYLKKYDYHDVSIMKLKSFPSTSWEISRPSYEQILIDAQQNANFVLHLRLTLNRQHEDSEYRTSYKDFSFQLSANTGKTILDFLEHGANNSLQLTQKLPLLFEARSGIISSIEFQKAYGNVTLVLHSSTNKWWWELKKSCLSYIFSANNVTGDCYDDVVFYVFSEKRIPGVFQYFTTKGIIGIYASVVIVIWGLIRTATSQMYLFVRYYSLPNVDSIHQLCHDIYLARESGQLGLEEDLFAKLLFLFRSPETVIKWTRQDKQQMKID